MFDVIVVGGGHAGIEASLAPARLGLRVALITLDINYVGSMPCNPSIGGPAKGIVVREIDALGGEMGKATDATFLQMKMLNTGKGPGVQCLRAQSDKIAYAKYMQNVLKREKNITILQTMATKLIVKDGVCLGVEIENGQPIYAKSVILTTGTFLDSKILVGHESWKEGPDKQRSVYGLSASMKEHGLEIVRFKTGTPARIYKDSIDYSKMEVQPGTTTKPFSFASEKLRPIEEQEVCYLIHTTLNTHEIIKDNLSKSAMYGGKVEGVGPRYCPSIEDKIVRFADKEQHQLFIEPESMELDTIYLQGFSTSMPVEVQELMIRSLPGLENCKVKKYAYAIEYDAINPLQLQKSLETKVIENLYCAGQINGTSGYEEAAGQGLMAGINASRKIKGLEPLVLKRNESYIGVLIDDLTTKGTNEPYRLLTSRSEYRLLLRHDNADLRLRKYGYDIGLISCEQLQKMNNKIEGIQEIKESLRTHSFGFKHPVNDVLESNNLLRISESVNGLQLLKRPFVTLDMIIPYLELEKEYDEETLEQAEIQVKYEGYIKKQEDEAAQMLKLENITLGKDVDYNLVPNLALEARQKLNKVKPENIGQASRISGVNPSDISILLMHVTNKKGN